MLSYILFLPASLILQLIIFMVLCYIFSFQLLLPLIDLLPEEVFACVEYERSCINLYLSEEVKDHTCFDLILWLIITKPLDTVIPNKITTTSSVCASDTNIRTQAFVKLYPPFTVISRLIQTEDRSFLDPS